MHIYTRLLELVKNKIEYGDLDLRQYLRDREERVQLCSNCGRDVPLGFVISTITCVHLSDRSERQRLYVLLLG